MGLRLLDGDRVCIVGGGPAGCFAALHLLRMARKRDLRLEVLIFEPRDFTRPGPGGCNHCAGILSVRLLRDLNRIELPLPDEVIQARLNAYAVHLAAEVVRIEQPDPEREIVSVYRGGGPRLLQGTPPASFDGYLLSRACARGAQHVPTRAYSVRWEDRPVVRTAGERFQADLLVLATGVNSRPPLSPAFGYHPPRVAVMAQDEFLRPPTWPGDQVGAFFYQPPGLVFGALIPKGRYLNVSLLGKGLATDAISDFLDAQGLVPALPLPPGSLCGCTPRIAVGPARGYFGDRWVAVGDAAVTRLYKDGIGSAFRTSRVAMHTALEAGIAHRDFRRAYAPFCRRVVRDNQFGRLLFRLWAFALQKPPLLRAWTRAVRAEAECLPERRIHTRVLWGMFTGDELYRDLFRLSVSPTALRRLWRGL